MNYEENDVPRVANIDDIRALYKLLEKTNEKIEEIYTWGVCAIAGLIIYFVYEAIKKWSG